MADGVHQARGLEATRCSPRGFGGGEARTSVVGVSPRRRGQSVSTQSSGRAMLSWKRGDMKHAGGQVLLQRPRDRVRGGGGGSCSSSERHRRRRRKCSPRLPDNEYASKMLFDVISSRSALSGPRRRSCFVHLQSIIHTDIGWKEFGRGMAAFWRKIVDEPGVVPPEFWQLFLQSSLTALGEKCWAVCVGMAWRRLISTGAMRQWRLRLEKVNREVGQFGVAVLGGVEHV